jgi:hypothetical protein
MRDFPPCDTSQTGCELKLQRTRSHSQPKATASPTVWGTSSRRDISTSHIAARDIAARLTQFFLKFAIQSDEGLDRGARLAVAM